MAYFRSNVSGGIPAGVRTLPTVDTASGSIATFDTDMTENLVEVKCQIVAQQASGTPSPSNPLPITTYTEMNVGATGKNLFDKNSAIVGLWQSDGTYDGNNSSFRTVYCRVKPNTTYYISGINDWDSMRLCFLRISLDTVKCRLGR